jgi:3-phosphoglycerate kinase
VGFFCSLTPSIVLVFLAYSREIDWKRWAGLFNKKTIRDIDLKGKRVLLRADYNVPISGGKITDDFRIKQSLPTVNYIWEQYQSSLVIISHLGRPAGKPDKSLSLEPVAKRLAKLLGKEVKFAGDCVGKEAKAAADKLGPGEILLLENVRFHPEEEKNDEGFAKKIVESTGAEVFVQDGFGVVHRAHASTSAIAKLLPSVAGLLLEREVQAIDSVMQDPQRPLLAVVGGSKISDKIDVLSKFIDIADGVAVAGALANNFLVAEGKKIGKSLYEPDAMDITRSVLVKARKAERERRFSFVVPVDATVSSSADGKKATRIVDLSSHSIADIEAYPKLPKPASYEMEPDEMILDIGPISAAVVSGAVGMSNTVVWAGTCGVTEAKGINGLEAPFSHGTESLIEAMIGRTNKHKNKPFSLVGGGDTVGYVQQNGLLEDFNHVSTGGSASLELIAGKKLPGVEVLEDK